MYRIQDQPLLFSINETSGVVMVDGTIDRETNSSFSLTIVAYEEGWSITCVVLTKLWYILL